MTKRIIISGWYGFGNIGDEAILSSMINTFKSTYPNVEIIVLSFRPIYTRQMQKVVAVHQIPISGFRPWIKFILYLRFITTLKAIWNCDLFVMGGGGFLSDWQPEVPKGWLKQMRLAKLFKKETLLYRIGAGPFLTQKGRQETAFYLNNFVDRISVRDKTSKSNLDNLDINTIVTIERDPVFDLQISSKTTERKKLIGINFIELFRHKSFQKEGNVFDEYLQSLKSIIDYMLDFHSDYKLEFVSFHESDTSFYYQYFSAYKINVIEPKEYTELVSHLNEYQLFIGSRFHSLVFSIKTKTPLLAIVYQHKSLDLCEQYHIDYDISSDGSLPPLPKHSINIEHFTMLITKKLTRTILE
jgi:polysaccharide pyruvyl transferase WcaK-like protein